MYATGPEDEGDVLHEELRHRLWVPCKRALHDVGLPRGSDLRDDEYGCFEYELEALSTMNSSLPVLQIGHSNRYARFDGRPRQKPYLLRHLKAPDLF